MTKYLFMLLILLANLSRAQTKPYPFQLVDRFCTCPEFHWDGNNFELNDIHKSTNDIEIRLTIDVPGRYKTITVLTRKDGDLNAFYYDKRDNSFLFLDSLKKYGKWERYAGKKFDIPKTGLDSILKEMVSHRIFTLVNMKEVYKQYYNSRWNMEVKENNHFNTYRFGPPLPPHEADAQRKELLDYTALIQIFNDLTDKYYQQA